MAFILRCSAPSPAEEQGTWIESSRAASLAVNLVVLRTLAAPPRRRPRPSRPAAQPSASAGTGGQPAAAPSRRHRRRSSTRWSLEAGEGRATRSSSIGRSSSTSRRSRSEAVVGRGPLEPRHRALRGRSLRRSPRRVPAGGRRADPENGTAWALKGLCEFRLKNFDAALEDLIQARKRASPAAGTCSTSARYHTAILLTRVGAVRSGADDPERLRHARATSRRGVIEAMGLAVLRMPHAARRSAPAPSASSCCWPGGPATSRRRA